MPDPRTEPGDEAHIQALLVAWYARIDAGENPDLVRHCAAHPQLRERLARLVDDERRLTRQLARERATECPQPIELPCSIGDFRLTAYLGGGGMGHVYLARQESLGRPVAIKILRPELARDARTRLRFQREAEVTAGLDHPNIVPVYGIDAREGQVLIAMKYLAGRPLDELDEPLAPRDAARIGAAIARALHSAHEVGVVHRDVKPGNVILELGIPYVLDFGLAWSAGQSQLTHSGAAPGTLAYMAPELFSETPPPPEPRQDVYALGATIYELAAGRPPFAADRPEALLASILLDEPERLPLVRADRDLDVIVRRALEKEPARRFPTALELAEDLERFAAGEAIRSRPAGPFSRAIRLARRNRIAVSLAGLLAVGAAIAGTAAVRDAARRLEAFQRATAATARAVEAGDYALARQRLEEIEVEHGARPELLQLARRADFLEDQDRLLDLLQSPLAGQDAEYLAGVAARLRERAEEVAASPLARLGLAFAAWAAGDAPAAARWIDASASVALPRAARALQALAAGGDPAAALVDPTAPAGTCADDHVFAALAVREGGGADAVQRAEIDRALDLDLASYRGRYARGILLEERGEWEAAWSALSSLREHPAHALVVDTALGRLELILGRPERARACLERTDTELEARRFSAPWLPRALLALQLAERTGDAAALERETSSALANWPDHPEVLLIAGRQAVPSDPTLARERFRRAAASTARGSAPGWARLALLESEFSTHRHRDRFDPPADLGADERAALAASEAGAAALLEDPRRPLQPAYRAGCELLRSRVLRVLGERGAAFEALQRALEADPSHTAANLRFAIEIQRRLQQIRRRTGELEVAASAPVDAAAITRRARAEVDAEDEAVAGSALGLARQARACARRVTRANGAGFVAVSEQQVLSALACDAVLSRELGDKPSCQRAAAEALARLPEEHPLTRQLEWLVQWAQ